MPGPKPPQILLNQDERVALENLVQAHKTGQALTRRARVVLLAATEYSNMDIARLVPMDEEAVGLWRRRWAAACGIPVEQLSVADRLADASLPGAVPRLTTEQVCQIVALGSEQPSGSGRPISQWSHRELADEIVRRGITDRISLTPPCAAVKKRPTSSHTECGIGSLRPPTPTATPRSLTGVPSTEPQLNVPRWVSAL